MSNKNNNNCAYALLSTECSQADQLITIYPMDKQINKIKPKVSSGALNTVAKMSQDCVTDLADNEEISCSIPWFILVICMVQILLYTLANEYISQLLIFDPALKRQFWRFLSYTLLHADLPHLLLNICLQCLVGLSLECEQGHWKIAFIYITGGISGSLATLILQPQLSLLGASAGIYSLLMSHVPHLVKNFSQLPYRCFRIAALIVLWLSDAGFTTFHFLVNHNENPRICLDAHIAGGVVGLLLGSVLYTRWDKRKLRKYWPGEKILIV